jgi:hypothetical protein
MAQTSADVTATQHRNESLLATYGLLDGELPPTIITSLWHGGFSANRIPLHRFVELFVGAEETEEAQT